MSSRSKKRKANTPAVDEPKFWVKAMLNKEKTKVLFLEVNSDFADVLLSFLTLPLGKIVRILEVFYGHNHVVFGSLTTLGKGLRCLRDEHFWSLGCAQMLIHPKNSLADECCKLETNLDYSGPTTYYTCGGDSGCKKKVTMYNHSTKCDSCGASMHKQLSFREESSTTAINNDCDKGSGGVFTSKTASFLITDDLKIMPNVPGSVFQTLSSLGITDVDGAELRTVHFGDKEMRDLLKGLLLSPTPLTDCILNKGHNEMGSSTTAYPEQGISSHHMETGTSSNSTKKMTVKAMVQKSTNKLLFLQADDDFVDFLFSLLTVPLGGVVRLLGGKTSLRGLEKFYKSIENLDSDKHLKNRDTKERLLNPMLPPMYRSVNQILPLEQRVTPTLYYYPEVEETSEFASQSPVITFKNETWNGSLMSIVDPKGGSTFVKRPGVFLVTDDLNVVPSSLSSTISLINKLKIPIADVGELEIDIGLEEGLHILKASLTSTNALTNGLSSKLRKQPKQER